MIQELPGAAEQECISRMLQECSWFHDEHPGALRSSQEHQERLSRSASPRALPGRLGFCDVVEEGGFVFPLCPSGQHGLKVVDAFMELWVYCLLKVINKANVAKSGGGSMNLKLSDEFLHRAVTLA